MGKLRDWAQSDREQADALDWFDAVSTNPQSGSEQGAKAEALRSTADGWDAIADAAGE